MDFPPPHYGVTVARAQQVIAECVLTELELGITFLDVAENTSDPEHARQSVKNAIIALRTANRFFSEIQPGANLDGIEQRRRQLAERLRAITGVDDPGGSHN